MHAHEGTSGFMRFLTADHGAWLARIGVSAKARVYTIGNPLIARTMLEHNIAAGLTVPVRLMIYEDPRSATTRLTYDLPSSLMSGLQNEKVDKTAKKLDAKLIALAVYASLIVMGENSSLETGLAVTLFFGNISGPEIDFLDVVMHEGHTMV
jgi:uncharacterized protein (DUF302 family)